MANNNNALDEGVFDSALANQKSVPETFFLDFSADQTVAQNIHQSDEIVQQQIRKIMEESQEETRFLFDFQTYGSESDNVVAEDLYTGATAAIDSTDMLPITDLWIFHISVWRGINILIIQKSLRT